VLSNYHHGKSVVRYRYLDPQRKVRRLVPVSSSFGSGIHDLHLTLAHREEDVSGNARLSKVMAEARSRASDFIEGILSCPTSLCFVTQCAMLLQLVVCALNSAQVPVPVWLLLQMGAC